MAIRSIRSSELQNDPAPLIGSAIFGQDIPHARTVGPEQLRDFSRHLARQVARELFNIAHQEATTM